MPRKNNKNQLGTMKGCLFEQVLEQGGSFAVQLVRKVRSVQAFDGLVSRKTKTQRINFLRSSESFGLSWVITKWYNGQFRTKQGPTKKLRPVSADANRLTLQPAQRAKAHLLQVVEVQKGSAEIHRNAAGLVKPRADFCVEGDGGSRTTIQKRAPGICPLQTSRQEQTLTLSWQPKGDVETTTQGEIWKLNPARQTAQQEHAFCSLQFIEIQDWGNMTYMQRWSMWRCVNLFAGRVRTP